MNYKILSKFLKEIKEEDIKSSQTLRLLLSKGLVRKITKNSKSIVNKGICENVPKWANKFRFTRKKYGLVEENTTSISYKISPKGLKLLRNINNVKEDSKDPKDNVKSNNSDIEEDINDSISE